MSEYHKIESLFERDEKTFKFKEPFIFKNPAHSLINLWEFTEKIDGTNIRLIWCAKEKALRIGGRTDKAQIPQGILDYVNTEDVRARFFSTFPDVDVVVYGEGYGAGIQAVGSQYREDKSFIVFDVLVNGKWWLSQSNAADVSEKLGFRYVPIVGVMSINDAVKFVREGFHSNIGTAPAEGLIGRTSEPLFDNKGHRLIVKIKTKDFKNEN